MSGACECVKGPAYRRCCVGCTFGRWECGWVMAGCSVAVDVGGARVPSATGLLS